MAAEKKKTVMVLHEEGAAAPTAAPVASAPPALFVVLKPGQASEASKGGRVKGNEKTLAVDKIAPTIPSIKSAAKSTNQLENLPPDKTCKGINFSLDNNNMWNEFFRCKTEMMLTNQGCRMFPYCRFRISGLEPFQNYSLVMDIQPVDKNCYKWNGQDWQTNGKAEKHAPGRVFIHPESPSSGHYWMQNPVSFYKLKLTNNTADQEGNVILRSLHRYLPRLHVVLSDKPTQAIQLSGPDVITVTFPQTEFFAVTAYQNSRFTQLKVDYNPFAKGLREDGPSSWALKLKQNSSNDSKKDEAKSSKELNPMKKSLKSLMAKHNTKVVGQGSLSTAVPNATLNGPDVKSSVSPANANSTEQNSCKTSPPRNLSELIRESHVKLRRCILTGEAETVDDDSMAAKGKAEEPVKDNIAQPEALSSKDVQNVAAHNKRRPIESDKDLKTSSLSKEPVKTCPKPAAESENSQKASHSSSMTSETQEEKSEESPKEKSKPHKRPGPVPLNALAKYLQQLKAKSRPVGIKPKSDLVLPLAMSSPSPSHVPGPEDGQTSGPATDPAAPTVGSFGVAVNPARRPDTYPALPTTEHLVTNTDAPFPDTQSLVPGTDISLPDPVVPAIDTACPNTDQSVPNSECPVSAPEASVSAFDRLLPERQPMLPITEQSLLTPEPSLSPPTPLLPLTVMSASLPDPLVLSPSLSSQVKEQAPRVPVILDFTAGPSFPTLSSSLSSATLKPASPIPIIPAPDPFLTTAFTPFLLTSHFAPFSITPRPALSLSLSQPGPHTLETGSSSSPTDLAASFQVNDQSLPTLPSTPSPLSIPLALSPSFSSLGADPLSPTQSLSDLVNFFSINNALDLDEFPSSEVDPELFPPSLETSSVQSSGSTLPTQGSRAQKSKIKSRKGKSSKTDDVPLVDGHIDLHMHPNLEKVEEQLFVSFTSKEALEIHLGDPALQEVTAQHRITPETTKSGPETQEEIIAAFEEVQRRDLKYMKHRQVIHPVLQEVGLKLNLLDPTLTIDLQYLGVRLPLTPPFQSPEEGSSGLELSTSGSVPFVSRTGKTTDITQIKGWREKFIPEDPPPSTSKPEAGPSADFVTKNLSAFCSDMLDEYLANEGKLIDERAASFSSQTVITPVVYELPIKSTSYVRTLDSVLKKQTPASVSTFPIDFIPPSKRAKLPAFGPKKSRKYEKRWSKDSKTETTTAPTPVPAVQPTAASKPLPPTTAVATVVTTPITPSTEKTVQKRKKKNPKPPQTETADLFLSAPTTIPNTENIKKKKTKAKSLQTQNLSVSEPLLARYWPLLAPVVDHTIPIDSSTNNKLKRKGKKLRSSRSQDSASADMAPLESDSELLPATDEPLPTPVVTKALLKQRDVVTKALLKQRDLEDGAVWEGQHRTCISKERAAIALTSLFTLWGFVSENPTTPVQVIKRRAPPCLNDFCRLGCVCSSLRKARRVTHCGKQDCIFGCSCLRQKVVLLKNLDGPDSSTSEEGSSKKKRKRRMRMAYTLKETETVSEPALRIRTLWKQKDGELDPEPTHIPTPVYLPCPSSTQLGREKDERMTCARVRAFQNKKVNQSDLTRQKDNDEQSKATESTPGFLPDKSSPDPQPSKRLEIVSECRWKNRADRNYILRVVCEHMAQNNLANPFRVRGYMIKPLSQAMRSDGGSCYFHYKVHISKAKPGEEVAGQEEGGMEVAGLDKEGDEEEGDEEEGDEEEGDEEGGMEEAGMEEAGMEEEEGVEDWQKEIEEEEEEQSEEDKEVGQSEEEVKRSRQERDEEKKTEQRVFKKKKELLPLPFLAGISAAGILKASKKCQDVSDQELVQVNGKPYPRAMLQLGQMGALHPANRLAAYLTGRLRTASQELSHLACSKPHLHTSAVDDDDDVGGDVDSVEQPIHSSVTPTTSVATAATAASTPTVSTLEKVFKEFVADQIAGKQQTFRSSSSSTGGKAPTPLPQISPPPVNLSTKPPMLMIPVPGTSTAVGMPCLPSQPLAPLTPGQRMVLQPVPTTTGHTLYRNPSGQLIQLVPLSQLRALNPNLVVTKGGTITLTSPLCTAPGPSTITVPGDPAPHTTPLPRTKTYVINSLAPTFRPLTPGTAPTLSRGFLGEKGMCSVRFVPSAGGRNRHTTVVTATASPQWSTQGPSKVVLAPGSFIPLHKALDPAPPQHQGVDTGVEAVCVSTEGSSVDTDPKAATCPSDLNILTYDQAFFSASALSIPSGTQSSFCLTQNTKAPLGVASNPDVTDLDLVCLGEAHGVRRARHRGRSVARASQKEVDVVDLLDDTEEEEETTDNSSDETEEEEREDVGQHIVKTLVKQHLHNVHEKDRRGQIRQCFLRLQNVLELDHPRTSKQYILSEAKEEIEVLTEKQSDLKKEQKSLAKKVAAKIKLISRASGLTPDQIAQNINYVCSTQKRREARSKVNRGSQASSSAFRQTRPPRPGPQLPQPQRVTEGLQNYITMGGAAERSSPAPEAVVNLDDTEEDTDDSSDDDDARDVDVISTLGEETDSLEEEKDEGMEDTVDIETVDDEDTMNNAMGMNLSTSSADRRSPPKSNLVVLRAARAREQRAELTERFNTLRETLSPTQSPTHTDRQLLIQAKEEISELSDKCVQLEKLKTSLGQQRAAHIKKIAQTSGKSEEGILRKLEDICVRQKKMEEQGNMEAPPPSSSSSVSRRKTDPALRRAQQAGPKPGSQASGSDPQTKATTVLQDRPRTHPNILSRRKPPPSSPAAVLPTTIIPSQMLTLVGSVVSLTGLGLQPSYTPGLASIAINLPSVSQAVQVNSPSLSLSDPAPNIPTVLSLVEAPQPPAEPQTSGPPLPAPPGLGKGSLATPGQGAGAGLEDGEVPLGEPLGNSPDCEDGDDNDTDDNSSQEGENEDKEDESLSSLLNEIDFLNQLTGETGGETGEREMEATAETGDGDDERSLSPLYLKLDEDLGETSEKSQAEASTHLQQQQQQTLDSQGISGSDLQPAETGSTSPPAVNGHSLQTPQCTGKGAVPPPLLQMKVGGVAKTVDFSPSEGPQEKEGGVVWRPMPRLAPLGLKNNPQT